MAHKGRKATLVRRASPARWGPRVLKAPKVGRVKPAPKGKKAIPARWVRLARVANKGLLVSPVGMLTATANLTRKKIAMATASMMP